MDLSVRSSRRGLIALAAALVALPGGSVRAQTTTVQGCSVSFINGLLRISASCPLMTPAGANMGGTPLAVAPPSHLVEVEQVAVAAGQTSHDKRVEQLLVQREHKDKKRQRKHDRRVKRDTRADAQ